MKLKLFLGLLFCGLVAGATHLMNISSTVIVSDSFEGIISFTKKVGKSESKYNYVVKGTKIRIEELGSDGKLQGIMLVDTKTNTVFALSPDRKMYMDVPSKKAATIPTTELNKTEKTQSLMNYTCKEWVVTKKEEDREVTYYLAFENFDFFIPLLKTLNRKDKQAIYFLSMKGVEGAFPMKSVEKKIDGTEISTLEVTSIQKKSVEDSQFEIPKGYTKFEN